MSIEAHSRDGITIGLVDAIITLANTLNERLAAEAKRLKSDPSDDHAWHSEPVRKALLDLAGNKALKRLLFPRDEKVMKILRDAAALHEARK